MTGKSNFAEYEIVYENFSKAEEWIVIKLLILT